jgi:hypothetical protein
MTGLGSTTSNVVSILPDVFQSCSISFSSGLVNRTQNMIVTIGPKNAIPNDGIIIINYPINGYWNYDIAQNNIISSNGIYCTNGSNVIFII